MMIDLHSSELPRWLRDFLSAVPGQGTGLHPWINEMAWRLMPWRSDHDTISLLAAVTANSGRNTTREITDAVRSARAKHNAGAGWHPGAQTLAMPGNNAPRVSSSPRWPDRDDAMIAAILADGVGEYDLWESSPHRFEHGNELEMSDMLEMLFPGDPLLCCGWEKAAWRTQLRSKWNDWPRKVPLQFIVPSPMSKPEGVTKEGKPSSKTNDNTGPRRFLVIEFDFSPARKLEDATLLHEGMKYGLHSTMDLCACLLHHLAQYGPLMLVVWSGGKSLQGWFPVVGEDEEPFRAVFHYACLLGADPATWTPSQFVRLPGGKRDNGNNQIPVFFNPKLLPPP